MRITKMGDTHGNDFWYDAECEHCGHVKKDVRGYHDAYYHQTVLPKAACEKCGKSRDGSSLSPFKL